ncbi:MAG: T9SS type A sorting domain-containing protein [Pedobacter sp.]|nr:MAG: T9SS type A sorting domain-containing protein [Pedobacter sp.]
MDAAPVTAINYYRIRAVETSGNIIYSKIVSVDRKGGKQRLQLFPNPVANGRINIRVEDLRKGRFDLRIVNSLGQVIKEEVINSTGGVFTREINIEHLNPGNYILLLTGEGLRQSMKFNVQRR